MNNKKILGVYNFWVYLIGCFLSLGFIGLGFIKEQGFVVWAEIFLYIGTSGIGAVVLAYFIEFSNNKIQDKKIQEFRKNQLCGLLSNLTFILNRTAWYFVRCFSVLDKNYSATQYYVLGYKELWGIFGELYKKYNNLMANEAINDKTYNEISSYNKHIVSYYRNAINTIANINSSIVFFESQGYFSHIETDILKASENLLNLIFDDGTMIYEDFKQFFENIIEINEFKMLENLKFYAYNNRIEYEDRASSNPLFAKCSLLAIVPTMTNDSDITQ